MNKICVVGIGTGNPDYILPVALKKISEADVLIGGSRSLETFSKPTQKTFRITKDLETVCIFETQLHKIEVGTCISNYSGEILGLDQTAKNLMEALHE